MPTLPALTKTYSVRANAPFAANTTALALAQSQTFNLKQHLINALTTGTLGGTRHANSVWTVKGSSNSTAAAMDGVDRWVAYTDLVWAANATAHSWIVLENATLGYQICIDCVNATSTNLSFAGTLISAPFTGGSTTTRPSGTEDFNAGNTTTTVGSFFVFVTDVTTGNFNYTHFVTADTGAFYFLVSRTGAGLFSSFLGLQRTINNHVSDTRNVFLMGNALASVRGAPRSAVISDTTLGCTGRNQNGTVMNAGGICNGHRAGTAIYPETSGVDSLTGNYLSFPCHVLSVNTQIAYRGEIPDLHIVGTATVGGSIPSAAAQARIVAGDFIIPFPTVIPNI